MSQVLEVINSVPEALPHHQYHKWQQHLPKQNSAIFRLSGDSSKNLCSPLVLKEPTWLLTQGLADILWNHHFNMNELVHCLLNSPSRRGFHLVINQLIFFCCQFRSTCLHSPKRVTKPPRMLCWLRNLRIPTFHPVFRWLHFWESVGKI